MVFKPSFMEGMPPGERVSVTQLDAASSGNVRSHTEDQQIG
jgi:hypothetical protein